MRLIAHAVARPGDDDQGARTRAGRAWRRTDPLARLALVAVDGLGGADWPTDTAVAVATAYGAVSATTRFVDSIAAHGDAEASPAAFAASVHSSSAGVLGQALAIHGPCTTIAQGSSGASAALRWAELMLAADRCSRVLVVAGECHNDWSTHVVGDLAALPWPVHSGCSAWLLARNGAGRELRAGEHPAAHCLDGGGGPRAEAALVERAHQHAQHRLRAPDHLGGWWPSSVLAAIAARPAEHPLQLRECGDDGIHAWWLGPDAT